MLKQTKSDISYCKKHKQYYQPMETKIIICQDCGKEIVIDSKDTHTKRCKDCLIIHKRELKRLEIQRYRQRKNNM